MHKHKKRADLFIRSPKSAFLLPSGNAFPSDVIVPEYLFILCREHISRYDLLQLTDKLLFIQLFLSHI